MTQHTPGPWFVQPEFFNVFALSEGMSGWTIHIAKVNPEQVVGGAEEALANARLMAAAPDMHASGKPLAELVADFSGPDDATIAVTAGELRRMAAAIAKAEGR